MSRRQILAALLGLLTAAGCARLGIWQLDRLRRVRIRNDIKVARLSAPPSSPFGLLFGTRQYRRVTVAGTFDFEHQVVLTGRSHDGAPGVDILTLFAPDPGGRPILVDRGWVYSADAQTIDVAKFDEAPHTTITGYIEEFALSGDGPARAASTPNAWRWLDVRAIDNAFPIKIAPFYIVAQADSGAASRPEGPVRNPLPSLDEGPHRGYAIQWFAFAIIALGGALIVIWKERQPRTAAKP